MSGAPAGEGKLLAAQARGGRRAFAYFNNDVAAQAVHDARVLQRALARLRAA